MKSSVERFAEPKRKQGRRAIRRPFALANSGAAIIEHGIAGILTIL
jgi:hypothetical protein